VEDIILYPGGIYIYDIEVMSLVDSTSYFEGETLPIAEELELSIDSDLTDSDWADISWYVNDVLIEDNGNIYSSYTIRDTGTITIEVVVEPIGGVSSIYSATFYSAGNFPTVTITDPVVDSITLFVGESKTFTALSEKSEGTATAFVWTKDGVKTSDSGTTAAILFDEQGTFVIAVDVTDSDGLRSAPDTVTVTVIEGTPIIDSLTGPELVYINDTATFQVFATDPNGTVNTYHWVCAELSLDTTTTSSSLAVATAIDGEYDIISKVIDNSGDSSATKTISLSVDLGAPVMDSVMDSVFSYINSVAILNAWASDTNGTVESYYWQFFIDPGDGFTKVYDTTTTTGVIDDFITDLVAPLIVTVVATDDDGQTTLEDTIKVTVDPGNPILESINNSETVLLNEDVYLWGDASDDGEIAMYYWYHSYDSLFEELPFDSSADGTIWWSPADTGTYTIYVDAYDDEGNWSDFKSVVIRVVLDENIPSISDISPDTYSPIHNSDVTFTVSTYDPTVTYTWYRSSDQISWTSFGTGESSTLSGIT